MDLSTQLARKAAAGDADAYSRLVFRHLDMVYRLTYRMTGEADAAEELSQEVFLRAWEALGTYNPERPFLQWLYTISLNLVRDFLRKQARTRSLFSFRGERTEQPDPAGEVTAETRLIWKERERRMQEGIGRLPVRLREALLLRYMEELSFENIAGVLGISVSAAKMRVYRGVDRLREEMGKTS